MESRERGRFAGLLHPDTLHSISLIPVHALTVHTRVPDSCSWDRVEIKYVGRPAAPIPTAIVHVDTRHSAVQKHAVIWNSREHQRVQECQLRVPNDAADRVTKQQVYTCRRATATPTSHLMSLITQVAISRHSGASNKHVRKLCTSNRPHSERSV
mmetsp:Transcript_27104/g.82125  ORF Transcript_27104/g.82125 Transcript_27104/m.82125 type:complete len:155 (+) Transcript_27104:682-1146(+)|eukprot:scaffold197128_cov40-Tisochrysis_lutea.AAC.2